MTVNKKRLIIVIGEEKMNKKSIDVYLAGDSTVQTYDEKSTPQAGWGQSIGDYFSERIRIYNHAIGGRSSKTFITEGRLDDIMADIDPGDYLLIQMGHNDSTKIRPERYTEPYEDYKTNLKSYVSRAREKNATPILITPVGRLHYVDGEFLADFGDYCNAMKEVASEDNVHLIDLMTRSISYFESIGYENAKQLFMVSVNETDCTHFTQKGADEMAQLVCKGIQDLGIELSTYVK